MGRVTTEPTDQPKQQGNRREKTTCGRAPKKEKGDAGQEEIKLKIKASPLFSFFFSYCQTKESCFEILF
jgi:hypothetical protein